MYSIYVLCSTVHHNKFEDFKGKLKAASREKFTFCCEPPGGKE